jgi:TonB-linked SusC/RagA family outer membrane protein
MKRKLMLFLSLLLIGVGLVSAQNSKKVTGVVVSEDDGQPVIGASVSVKGTRIGTTTDIDGSFTLGNIPSDEKTLVVSYIGMVSQEVVIKPKLSIVLKSQDKQLNEVVVVGYGTAKKIGTIVGSVSQVSGDKIDNKPVANALDALQGEVAGLSVFQSSGEPGAGAIGNSTVQSTTSSYIRGVGSLTAGNDPLYVLDGSPVDPSIMTTINSNDIASVTVLKDASATSIYGSRAANGVIYITTKRGAIGEKAVIKASYSYGTSDLGRRIGTPMNSSQLLDYQLKDGVINQDTYNKYKKSGVNTNWQDYFFKDDAPTRMADLSAQGGTKNTMYYLSGSYLNQQGIVYHSAYKRYTFRSNIESQLNNWLRMGANVAGTYDNIERAMFTYQTSNSLNGGIFGSQLFAPYYNPYDANGKRLNYISGLNRYSYYYLSDNAPSNANTARANGDIFIQLTPIDGLTIRSQAGIDAYDYRSTSKYLPSYPGRTGAGTTTEGFIRDANLTITNTAEYKFNVGKNAFTLLAGQEGIRNDFQKYYVQATGISDDRLTMLGNGTALTPISQLVDADAGQTTRDYNDIYTYKYLSFFGRLDYSWSDKYFADFSIRSDGSSRFGKNNRTATFYSAGVMWNAKKENFLKNIDVISDLELKANIGTTGNSEIGNYDHLAQVGTSSYNGATGWELSSPGNEDLGWEKQTLTNIGMELSLLKKYHIDFSWYKRTTDKMLMYVPLPYTAGFQTSTQNIGSMSNTGIELSLDLDLYKSKDWYVGFRTNFSYNKNKITKLFYGYKEWPMENQLTAYIVGKTVDFYLPVYKGVDKTDGSPTWSVPGKSGTVTKDFGDGSSLYQDTGKPLYAPYHGGFGLTIGYKGLSLSSDFAWVYKKYLVNNDRYFTENPSSFPGFNQSTAVLDEWSSTNKNGNFPAFGNQMQFDTHLLENASFLRLKNISLSYDIPKSLLGYTKVVNGIKVTATARNLFTITKYKGADPEVDSNLTYGAYPNTRQYTVGVEFIF